VQPVTEVVEMVEELEPTPVPTLDKMKTLSLTDGKYRYAWLLVENINKLRLAANFEEALGSENLIRRDECVVLVNGGFYNTNDSPIGWFYAMGEEISESEANNLFNGYISVASDSAVIAATREENNLVSGLQSGPLLAEGGQFKALSINNDERRRRVVAVTGDSGEVYFGVVTGANSLFEGPLLGDLSRVVEAITKQEGVSVEGAINLDGGSASAFYDGDIYIRETSYIGSYFCLNS